MACEAVEGVDDLRRGATVGDAAAFFCLLSSSRHCSFSSSPPFAAGWNSSSSSLLRTTHSRFPLLSSFLLAEGALPPLRKDGSAEERADADDRREVEATVDGDEEEPLRGMADAADSDGEMKAAGVW